VRAGSFLIYLSVSARHILFARCYVEGMNRQRSSGTLEGDRAIVADRASQGIAMTTDRRIREAATTETSGIPQGQAYDVLLVGAGLANSLISLALLKERPELSILLIEGGAQVGGNHTWSFHSTDIDEEGRRLLRPLIEAYWPSQEIRFPNLRRIIDTGYNAIASPRLHAAIVAEERIDLVLRAPASHVDAAGATLEDGRRFTGRCVIDGRGAMPTDALALGYQKFVGLEVELEAPHEIKHPVIMDATVTQHDGYRFVYTLPFSPTRILIEDTYYSDGPDLSAGLLADRARAYADAKGWRIGRVLRQEQGVLPITLAGDIARFWIEGPQDAARSGMRACLFHPTTGYSLPDAVLLAQRIARAPKLDTRSIDQLIRRHSYRCWQQRGFFRLLNRMLFLAAKGEQRRAVLERFYSLPVPLIERFYAARITSGDKARILLGRPPLPIPNAIRHLSEAQALAAINHSPHGGSSG
jgi:lycopene beta-cyclase